MKRILYANLLSIPLFFIGYSAFADCRISGGHQRDVDIEIDVTQNKGSSFPPVNIIFTCTGSNNVNIFTARDDPDGFQQKLDRLLNDLEIEKDEERIVTATFHLYQGFINSSGAFEAAAPGYPLELLRIILEKRLAALQKLQRQY